MPDFLRSHGPKVAIGGLVLINAALVTALISRQPALTAEPAGSTTPTAATATHASPATSTGRTPTSTASASPTTDSSTGPASSPSASATTDRTGRDNRLLAVSSNQVAWRSTSGGCRDRSRLEVSTDAGRSWHEIESGLQSIVRLKTYAEEAVFAVGADDRCRPAFVRLSDPRATAARDDDQLVSTWYRIPSRPNVIHSPTGQTTAPCGSRLLGLAGLGTFRAAALCADGRVRTIEEGRRWRTVSSNSGGVAVNADDAEFALLAQETGCPGLVLRRFTAGGVGLGNGKGDCLDVPRGTGSAVAIRGGSAWAWVGDTVRTS